MGWRGLDLWRGLPCDRHEPETIPATCVAMRNPPNTFALSILFANTAFNSCAHFPAGTGTPFSPAVWLALSLAAQRTQRGIF